MYDTVLLPLDMSSANELVLRRAQQLGASEETRLVLLHVIETLQDEEPGEMEDFYQELQEEAEGRLETWAADVADAGFDVETMITYGERGPEITRVAAEEDADLVIMRSRLLDRDDPESSVGTISHQVAVFAPCSVLLERAKSA